MRAIPEGDDIVDAVAARVRREAPCSAKFAAADRGAVGDLIDTHFFFLAIFVILGFCPA
jgi:hypothetical protein